MVGRIPSDLTETSVRKQIRLWNWLKKESPLMMRRFGVKVPVSMKWWTLQPIPTFSMWVTHWPFYSSESYLWYLNSWILFFNSYINFLPRHHPEKEPMASMGAGWKFNVESLSQPHKPDKWSMWLWRKRKAAVLSNKFMLERKSFKNVWVLYLLRKKDKSKITLLH